jgi:hypothetical protein
MRSGRVDRVVFFTFRFVSDRLPSLDELATYVGPRSDKQRPGEHWSTFAGRWRDGGKDRKNLGLLEFSEPYDVIELWFDPSPNDQLQLIWVLDCFRSYPETAAKLRLRHVDYDLITTAYDGPEEEELPEVDVTAAELEPASMTWQAYRATTPEACFDLLQRNLSAFPLLKPALIDLLEELPSSVTGLGATEMRLLELVGNGYASTNTLFYRRTLRQRRVFNDLKLVAFWRGLPTVRGRPWRASTTNCACWRRRTPSSASKHSGAAGCPSPNSARRSSRTRKISAAIIRSIAGGAVRGLRTIGYGISIPF